ncbi:putative transcription regulator [Delphinella strobiligena]|nr:putative transcription regulator [Delphinella strobiligena]
MGGGQELPPRAPHSHPLGSSEAPAWNKNLWALVDMGSNGIRLSISDLSSPTTRILPTVYSYRKKISLYDEQYDDDGNKIPIPDSTIDAIVAMLLRFKIFCSDFLVPPYQIRLLATEATRTATNSAELRRKILDEANLHVQLLSKEDEGRIGAFGVASSFSAVRGLVMDLGGGSTQITWMIVKDGRVEISPAGAISFPYGAAALTRKLEELEKGKSKHEAKEALDEFRDSMEEDFRNAYHELEIPEELIKDANNNGGFPLYLTGGGFRGWGFLLLHVNQTHGKQYPISIINGFKAHKDAFQDTEALKEVARTAHEIFRVSDRRRAQVPAVAFLINALAEAIPNGILEAHFCQGGVREGVLFQQLTPEIRAQSPIEVATSQYAKPLAPRLAALITQSLPPRSPQHTEPMFEAHMIRALANMFYVHSDMSKELASTSALYTTSTGLIASIHGVSHENRARLALLLEARYEGELAPREVEYQSQLRQLLSPEEAWWAEYVGAVALVLSRAYPAGVEEDALSNNAVAKKPVIELSVRWTDDLGRSQNKQGIILTFGLRWSHGGQDDPMKIRETIEDHVKAIKKVGKKKNAIDGFRIKVKVVVEDLY